MKKLTPLAAICLLALGVAPLPGQVHYRIGNVTYTVSDSLPDDPAEFVRQGSQPDRLTAPPCGATH